MAREKKTITVGELLAILERLPKDANVYAYEGEGGAWILVKAGFVWLAEIAAN